MKRYLLFVMLIIISIAALILPIDPARVSGSGSTTLTCYIYADVLNKAEASWTPGVNQGWNYWYSIASYAFSQDGGAAEHELGWFNFPTAGNSAPHWQGMFFDCTALPAGVEVSDIKLRVYVNSKAQNYYWQQFYGVYTGNPGGVNTFAAADCNDWHIGNPIKRLSQVVSYDNVASGDWLEFVIKDWSTGSFDYVTNDANGYVPFYLLPTHFALNYSPTWSGAWNYRYINIATETSAHPPELVITYQTTALPRTSSHDTNAAVASVNATDGTEYTSNISWGTPRTTYKDDDGIWFIVGGGGGSLLDGQGENITLQLESDDNSILLSAEDSIRIDGNFDWWIPAASLTEYRTGFVRAHETTSNVYSKWGYLAESPSNSERTNDIYSLSTEYPQWDEPFSSYVTTAGNMMFVHWKTNIDIATENSTHNLQIRSNGVDGTNNLFNHNLGWLHTDYYEGTNVNAQGNLHWRYAIFTMDGSQQGYNNYDGMIIDLGKPLSNSIKGFVQPCIYRTSDNVVMTDTHTSYWYLLNSSEYLIMGKDKESYKTNEDVIISINVPPQTQIPTYLASLSISVSGATVATTQLLSGLNSLSFKAPGFVNDYSLQFILSGSGVENYQYIYQLPLSVTAGDGTTVPGGTPNEPTSVSGWKAWFDNMMQRYGLNNTAGHWLIVFLLALILAIAFRKQKGVATVLVLLVFAGGFAFKWIDPWFIALMCIGAGLTIYGFFRKKERGSTGDES